MFFFSQSKILSQTDFHILQFFLFHPVLFLFYRYLIGLMVMVFVYVGFMVSQDAPFKTGDESLVVAAPRVYSHADLAAYFTENYKA